jgi:hypothetical protein
MMIPPLDFSSSLVRFNNTLSCNGLIAIVPLL